MAAHSNQDMAQRLEGSLSSNYEDSDSHSRSQVQPDPPNVISASASGKAKLWKVAKTIRFIKERQKQKESGVKEKTSSSFQESMKNINVSVLDLM